MLQPATKKAASGDVICCNGHGEVRSHMAHRRAAPTSMQASAPTSMQASGGSGEQADEQLRRGSRRADPASAPTSGSGEQATNGNEPVREDGGGFDPRAREEMQSGRLLLRESNDWGWTGRKFRPVRRRLVLAFWICLFQKHPVQCTHMHAHKHHVRIVIFSTLEVTWTFGYPNPNRINRIVRSFGLRVLVPIYSVFGF